MRLFLEFETSNFLALFKKSVFWEKIKTLLDQQFNCCASMSQGAQVSVFLFPQGQTVFDLCDPDLDDYLDELKEKQATVRDRKFINWQNLKERNKSDQYHLTAYSRDGK